MGRLMLLCVLLLCQGPLWAHAKQENYVWLNVEADAIVGRFELNTNDLRDKLDIDIDELADTRLEGVQIVSAQIEQFLRDNYRMSDDAGDIPYTFGSPSVFEEGSNYLQFPYRTTRPPAGNLITIRNSIFLVPPYSDQDRFHRSMIVAEYNQSPGADQTVNDGNVAIVFSPKRLEQTLDLEQPGSILDWKDFLWQGMVHIGIGLDHILFIAVLLLSAVVKNDNGRWEPVSGLRPALFNTLKIVTVFTLAHSITLTLAALDLVNVPSAFVETVIALSIIAMALHNLFPVLSGHSWILIFVFGLFHGLGFASVMGDLQFRVGFLERILIMFNIGVEVGQLILVAILLPLLYLIRKQSFYQPFILRGMSIVIMLLAGWWVLERTGLVAA